MAAAKPWRKAFRLDCNFPGKLVGPVLFFALIRLAVIFLSEVIGVLSTEVALGRGLCCFSYFVQSAAARR
jgi:hypothetical protein